MRGRRGHTMIYFWWKDLRSPYNIFVAQLDIVFHFNKVYAFLDEFILAGEVQETNKKVILNRIAELEKIE